MTNASTVSREEQNLLVVLAENWLLLVSLPIVVGAIVWFTASSQTIYYSTATVDLPVEDVRTILGPEILSSAIERAGVDASFEDLEAGLSIDQTPLYERALFRLKSPSPDVQSILAALIVEIEASRRLSDAELQKIRSDLRSIESGIEVRQRVIDSLQSRFIDGEGADQIDATTFAQGVDVLRGYLADAESLSQARGLLLEQLDLSYAPLAILVPPLPAEQAQDHSRRVLVSVLAAAVTICFLIIALFILKKLRRVAADPTGTNKT